MIKAIVFIALITIFIIECVIVYDDKKQRRKFEELRETLLDIVIGECGKEGVYKLPTMETPKAYDAKTDREELKFVQYAYDGRQRDIYISKDGKYIKTFDWK